MLGMRLSDVSVGEEDDRKERRYGKERRKMERIN